MTRVENEVLIEAPLSEVWATLVDTGRYREWNPRLVRVEGALVAGGVVTLRYDQARRWMPRSFVVDVDVVEPKRELRWSGPRNAARRALRASHYFLLDEAGAHTRLVHGERFEGALARRIWPLLGPAVEEGHADVNRALKERCEG